MQLNVDKLYILPPPVQYYKLILLQARSQGGFGGTMPQNFSLLSPNILPKQNLN